MAEGDAAEGDVAGAAEDTGCGEEAWSFGAACTREGADALAAGIALPGDARGTGDSSGTTVAGETGGDRGAESAVDGLEVASAFWVAEDVGEGAGS